MWLTSPRTDTNILISHLPLLRSFVDLSSSLPSPQRPTLLIPHIVLRELDGLKTSGRSTDIAVHSNSHSRPNRMTASISTLARAATNWLLSAIPSSGTPSDTRSIVRGQRKTETLLSKHAMVGENNDSLVLDAAVYFLQQAKRVVLLSDDNNLRLRAKFEQVEALTVDTRIGNDPEKLLDSLDPSIRRTPPLDSKTTIPIETRATNGHSRSIPSPPTSPRSPPRTRSQKSLPPRSPTKATPLPLPSTIARSNSMELDPEHTVPLHASRHPPTLLPATSPSSIYSNLLILFAHFLALNLYKTVYYHHECRPDGGNATQRKVLEDLGDWREWDAARCGEVIKKYWNEGGIRTLCEKGYEKMNPTTSAPPPPPPIPSPAKKFVSTPASPPRSRWASTPTSPPLKPISPPRPPPPSRPTLSPAAALSNLHSTLPYLISTLSLPSSTTSNWSSIKFEILLEALGNWLMILLSGILGSCVKEDVEGMVRNWEDELKSAGVGVSRVKLGL